MVYRGELESARARVAQLEEQLASIGGSRPARARWPFVIVAALPLPLLVYYGSVAFAVGLAALAVAGALVWAAGSGSPLRGELERTHARIAELEEAIRHAREGTKPRSRGRGLGVVAAIALAVVWTAPKIHACVKARESTAVRLLWVDEAKRGLSPSQDVFVRGEVVSGSIVRREAPCAFRFELEHGGVRMPVSYEASCVLPEPFGRPGFVTIVRGALRGDGVFAASDVRVKLDDTMDWGASPSAK